MLTRVSKIRSGKLPESCYVAKKAKVERPNASSVRTTSSARSRQVGSDTKRASTDGLSATFPRGDSEKAKLGASRSKEQRVSGNAHVFVIDKHKNPLMPCQPARARELLRKGRAVVVRRHPFTIRIKDRVGGETQPVSLKLDPGSKITGIAVARESKNGTHCLWLAELEHRGDLIHKRMGQRSRYRRRRRHVNLRYRPVRFWNRKNQRRRLAPSIQHRVETTTTWANRICKICPIVVIKLELVKFDTQRIQTPNIRKIEYHQGTLAGYEVREYLLEKWNHRCAYCGIDNVPLQIEHVIAKSNGGSNRVSNLVISCKRCNEKKGTLSIKKFLENNKATLFRILSQMKSSLRDASVMNSTRYILRRSLRDSIDIPIRTASGGKTKWNRSKMHVPKTHALDALCVGKTKNLTGWMTPTLIIRSNGRGSYQRTRVTSNGFPRGYLIRKKCIFGFKTGDMVSAAVPIGKKQGIWIGRVAIRASGSFDIRTVDGVVQGVCHKYCKIVMSGDGYEYSIRGN